MSVCLMYIYDLDLDSGPLRVSTARLYRCRLQTQGFSCLWQNTSQEQEGKEEKEGNSLLLSLVLKKGKGLVVSREGVREVITVETDSHLQTSNLDA